MAYSIIYIIHDDSIILKTKKCFNFPSMWIFHSYRRYNDCIPSVRKSNTSDYHLLRNTDFGKNHTTYLHIWILRSFLINDSPLEREKNNKIHITTVTKISKYLSSSTSCCYGSNAYEWQPECLFIFRGFEGCRVRTVAYFTQFIMRSQYKNESSTEISCYDPWFYCSVKSEFINFEVKVISPFSPISDGKRTSLGLTEVNYRVY